MAGKRLIDVSNENVKAVLGKYQYYPDEIWKFTAMTERFPTEDVATVHRWIPVAERLPGNDDFVLVIVSGKAGNITLDNAAELASFSMDEGWILEMWPEWEDPKVTYWMPLPEPPKEERP